MTSARKRYFVVLMLRRGGGGRQSSTPSTIDTSSIGELRKIARHAIEHTTRLFAKSKIANEIVQVDLSSDAADDLPPSPHLWRELRSLALESTEWWRAAQGRYSNTVEVARLAHQTRQAAREAITRDDFLVVLTNQELTPPPDWRYILWDDSRSDRHAVISATPMDPIYWSERVTPEERFEVIYARMRAALCAVIGELEGVHSCENQRCFMYRPVSSVLELDDMEGFGSEHRIDGISDLGFSGNKGEAVQPIFKSFDGVP